MTHVTNAPRHTQALPGILCSINAKTRNRQFKQEAGHARSAGKSQP
jgi:hypothetical protein